MADITITRGSTLPDSSAKSDFHNLVDLATGSLSNIVNADISGSAAIAASKLDLSSVGQKIVMTAKAIDQAKGSDIASATTTDIGAATGNFVDVTGTTTITGLGTIQAGAIRFVRFTGALTLTHNATSLILPTAANITTVANDRAIFVSLGSGNWLCVAYQRADGTPIGSAYTPTASNALSGSVIQVVHTQTGSVATGTTTIPNDDTIPQNTEGDQYMTLAITPNNASNFLQIEVVIYGGNSGNALNTIALFQDSTANALAAVGYVTASSTAPHIGKLSYRMTAGTTSSTTFKIRVGGESGTFTLNGASGGRKYGGVACSSMTIMEIKA